MSASHVRWLLSKQPSSNIPRCRGHPWKTSRFQPEANLRQKEDFTDPGNDGNSGYGSGMRQMSVVHYQGKAPAVRRQRKASQDGREAQDPETDRQDEYALRAT